MGKIKLSASATKGFSSVLAGLAVAACVTAALYPWSVLGSSDANVWSTWDGFETRPLQDLLSLALAPLAALVIGFVLVLSGLSGRPKHLLVAAMFLLAAAPLYYVGVIQESSGAPEIGAGFWLVLVAAGLAFGAAKTGPSRA